MLKTRLTDQVGTPKQNTKTMQNERNTNAVPVEWLTRSDLAQHFKCSVRHINKLMNRRILSFLKIGRFVRFDLAACDQAMKKYQTNSLFA